MRGLRSMTQEEREFAEQHHNMVIDYLRCKHLPMDDFYDIVIFGYPSAVQQYFRNPPANVEFKAMAFRAMKDSVLRESEYHARAKRCGITVGLDDAELTDHRQDTEQQIEGKVRATAFEISRKGYQEGAEDSKRRQSAFSGY